MQTFRHTFRTEAAIDLTRLLVLILSLDPEFLLLRVEPGWAGGLRVECRSVLTRTNMLRRIAEIEDGHVMAQTLETADAPEVPQPKGARCRPTPRRGPTPSRRVGMKSLDQLTPMEDPRC